MYRIISGAIALLFLTISSCTGNKVQVLSPDKKIVLEFFINESGGAGYKVIYTGKTLIAESVMGMELEGMGSTGQDVKIGQVIESSRDETWQPVYGERSEYRDHYNQSVISLTDQKSGKEKMIVTLRAYNEGVAFRYTLPGILNKKIIKENTQFVFPSDAETWVSSRAQGPIDKMALSAITEEYERPLLIEADKETYLALGEANLVDFARMKFVRDSCIENCLTCSLSGEVIAEGEITTPWRFIMVGESPSRLLENNFLLLNLCEPNRIDNTSWIRPGKVIREVTLTTTGGKACVDFAVKNNLQFIEFDAGWYGNEYDDASDATTVTVDPRRSPGPLDLHEVVSYATERDIGVILYVNRRSLEKQLDDVLPLLRSWGISGVKYGFVNVGSQYWTSWLHEAVRKAAEYQLMVDIHDEYRPTGYSRTYPNLMTQEGIRGDEESPPNEMVLNTIFTRMIAGAGDQTNCYFAERVTAKLGSHASQMAKAICIYSPWQFLFWYDRPQGSPGKKGGAGDSDNGIPDIPDLGFYARLPTVWDDTKVLEGYPGEYAVIARRSGRDWFVGGLNGISDRQFDITLDFLEPGISYNASIYFDDKSMGTATNIGLEKLVVNKESVISRKINKRQGLAIQITPEK